MLAKAESTVVMWRRSASVFQPAFYLRHAEMPEQQEISENLIWSLLHLSVGVRLLLERLKKTIFEVWENLSFQTKFTSSTWTKFKFSDNTKFRFVKVSEIHLFLTKIYVTRFLILVC